MNLAHIKMNNKLVVLNEDKNDDRKANAIPAGDANINTELNSSFDILSVTLFKAIPQIETTIADTAATAIIVYTI